MPALNTDLVRQAAPNFATTLANSILVSDNSMILQSATGLPTSTAITLVIDATDPVSGASTPSLKEVITGTLSGTTVSNLLRGQDGTTAQGHAAGANVVMWITANLWNDFQTSYLVGHTQLGAHISNLPLTSPKITTSLNDTNNNELVSYTPTSSAVNQLNVTNAATGNAPVLGAAGNDTNIGITITPKGTGTLTLNGLNVQTQANAGTAGGTMSYINLGGIKLLWSTTPSLSATGSTSTLYGVTFPTSFFTTITSVTLGITILTVSDQQRPLINTAPSTSSMTLGIRNDFASAGTASISYLVIGT